MNTLYTGENSNASRDFHYLFMAFDEISKTSYQAIARLLVKASNVL